MLASVPGGRGFLEAGQVNGNFAVFTQSRTGTAFNVWLYNIAQKTLTVIPNPLAKVHTSAVVNSFGTVYFEQSGAGCGADATVEEYPVGGPLLHRRHAQAGDRPLPPVPVRARLRRATSCSPKIHCQGGATDIYKTTFA